MQEADLQALADSVFAQAAQQGPPFDVAAFERLCSAHPHLAAQLRVAYDAHQDAERLLNR
jgi:hypothetical protein